MRALRLAALIVLVGLAFVLWAGTHDSKEAAAEPVPIAVNPNTPPDIAERLIAVLKSGSVPGGKFKDIQSLRDFYGENGFSLLWLTSTGEPTGDAKAALALLETAWTHGLNPLNYNVEDIRNLMDAEGPARRDLELILSEGVMRYGRDLTGMRVTPASVGQTGRYWQPPMRGYDILKWIEKNRGNARSAMEKLAPQGKLYKKLREDLISLLVAPEEKSRAPVRARGNLKPGTHHAAVPIIRAYLNDARVPPEGPDYYDDALATKVMVLQEEHGITSDGIIGPATEKIFNMTRMDRINQLVANLERQRWMDREKPPKYVMVNIPSATLWAVQGGGATLQMKVIVGRETRPTNSFKATITGVRFNPTWTVPPTIKKEDYLPKLIEDPEYLAKRGIDIRHEGKSIDPATVDWAALPAEELQRLTMVQGSGETNPLGRIRVLMPNNYNIYLHDTNDRSVFSRNSRGLSSGCIRVEQPEELADFILSDNQEWSHDKMKALLEAGRMRDIAAQTPIPVYLVYNTIWEKEGGKLIYGSDVYGMDDQLMGAIRKINGFQVPDNIKEIVTSPAFGANTGLDYRRLNQ